LLTLAVAGLMQRHQLALRLMLARWATISVALSFGSPGLGFIVVAIPGPIQTAFYRYLPASWLLCLCILAGLALDDVCRGGSRLRSLVGGVAVLIMLTMALRGLDMPAEGLFRDEFARHTTWAAAGFGLLLAGLIVMPTLPAAARGGAMAVVLAAESVTWFVLPTFVYPRHARLDLGVVRFLDANLGLQRFATLGPISPNYGSTSASHR
jgi:hypothetical protein